MKMKLAFLFVVLVGQVGICITKTLSEDHVPSESGTVHSHFSSSSEEVYGHVNGETASEKGLEHGQDETNNSEEIHQSSHKHHNEKKKHSNGEKKGTDDLFPKKYTKDVKHHKVEEAHNADHISGTNHSEYEETEYNTSHNQPIDPHSVEMVDGHTSYTPMSKPDTEEEIHHKHSFDTHTNGTESGHVETVDTDFGRHEHSEEESTELDEDDYSTYYDIPPELMPIHPGGGSRFDDIEKEKIENEKELDDGQPHIAAAQSSSSKLHYSYMLSLLSMYCLSLSLT